MFRFRVAETRRYSLLVASMLAALVGLNVADILSTRVALGIGLSEGNGALLGLSATLGTGTVPSLLMLKMAFLAGAVVVTILGMRSRATSVRFRVFAFLLALTVIGTIVLANNLYLIGEA